MSRSFYIWYTKDDARKFNEYSNNRFTFPTYPVDRTHSEIIKMGSDICDYQFRYGFHIDFFSFDIEVFHKYISYVKEDSYVSLPSLNTMLYYLYYRNQYLLFELNEEIFRRHYKRKFSDILEDIIASALHPYRISKLIDTYGIEILDSI